MYIGHGTTWHLANHTQFSDFQASFLTMAEKTDYPGDTLMKQPDAWGEYKSKTVDDMRWDQGERVMRYKGNEVKFMAKPKPKAL